MWVDVDSFQREQPQTRKDIIEVGDWGGGWDEGLLCHFWIATLDSVEVEVSLVVACSTQAIPQTRIDRPPSSNTFSRNSPFFSVLASASYYSSLFASKFTVQRHRG